MKLDKYKIKKHILSFIMLSLMLWVGIICSLNVFDFFVETVEIDAVVTYTYETQHNVHTHNPGGSKMNIEWVDLNGEIRTDGSIANDEDLSEGDTYTILVDAETHSRRMLSKAGNIVLFIIGAICCVSSAKLIKFCYGRDSW